MATKAKTRRKRPPGSGRRPQGPADGVSAMITARITPALRAELEREAKKHRPHWSISQVIQSRLMDSFDTSLQKGAHRYGQTDEQQNRNRALGSLVGELAALIEQQTGEAWDEDAYTWSALMWATRILLDKLGTSEGGQATTPHAPEILVPPKVKAEIERNPEINSYMHDPMDLGRAYALGLVSKLVSYSFPTEKREGMRYPDDFYRFPLMRKHIKVPKG